MADGGWDQREDLPPHLEPSRTFGEMVDEAADYLRRQEVPDPRRMAVQLYRALRGSGRYHEPLPAPETPLPRKEIDDYIAKAEELGFGCPIAYLAGWTGFRHLVLHTDRRALVPRPETEGLIDLALARVRSGVAADIGTGTGAIALSLAREGEFDQVIATDISRDALVLARRNARSTGLAVSWRLGDLTMPLRRTRVDLLVSNPPYLSVLEYDQLDRSVREWEPATALIGGSDGLEFYRRLLGEGATVMQPGGWIALEIDARRPAETRQLAVAAGWVEVTVYDDLFGRARYLVARRES